VSLARFFGVSCFLLASLGTASSLVQAALPPAFVRELAQAGVSPDHVSWVWLKAATGRPAHRRWATHRPRVLSRPASLMKLVTTSAALDRLGPAFVWKTPVYLQGAIENGTLHGSVWLEGRGDPQLVGERLWLLLNRLASSGGGNGHNGIARIDGDIVLDRHAFHLENSIYTGTDIGPGPNTWEAAAQFDGAPERPYNASPEAFLVNYKSHVVTVTPSNPVLPVSISPVTPQQIETGGGAYDVSCQPLVQGAQCLSSPPVFSQASCGDLHLTQTATGELQWQGRYGLACPEKTFALADRHPDTYALRAVGGVWAAMGKTLTGQVRWGQVPAGLSPRWVWSSPPLWQAVHDINKFSNNLMAQQLFLTIGLADQAVLAANAGVSAPASLSVSVGFDQAVQTVTQWWQRFVGMNYPLRIERGAGLSRTEAVSAEGLAQLLRRAYASPWMPELMGSLPIQGVDGTLAHRQNKGAVGLAHLKTGSLKDVTGMAGYVHKKSGDVEVFVVIVNDPNAPQTKKALDHLVAWCQQQN
jgi:D-alanyl-D-alanine carboxypeptidase/D-alanyl-D-alanine-endopeptidase (penicillin-binding protein 4)